jgi:tRNA(Ile)-lysidine synthase
MASSRNSRSTELVESAVRECLAGLPHGSRVGIALSGGLDSSVLLATSALHAEGRDITLSAVHIHHGLSPRATEWVEFCRAVCVALNIPIEVVHVAVPLTTGEGLEAAARRVRYQAFESHAADYILLAHHANDQAETLLFNLMRGTGVRGAAGIPSVGGAAGRYLRPLLACARTDLEAYAKQHALRWVEDESNEDKSFSRNYIRHEVIPVLEARFPAAVESLSRAAEHFSEAQGMLDEIARMDLGDRSGFPVPVSLLRNLSESRARNVLRYLLGNSGLQAPGGKRLGEVLRQFIEAGADRHPSLDLPNYRLYRQRDAVHLQRHS